MVNNYQDYLTLFGKRFGKPFKTAKREDIERFFANTGMKASGKVKVVRKLYQWLHECEKGWDYEIEMAKAKGGGADYGKRLDKETMSKLKRRCMKTGEDGAC